MRLITTLSLFFLAKPMYLNSYRAWIIFFNGIAYHGYETPENYYFKNTSLIRNYDILCNFLITLYTVYYYPISRPYAINGTINYILLYLLNNYKNNNKNKIEYMNVLKDLMHVFMVQIPLFKGLELSLNMIPYKVELFL